MKRIKTECQMCLVFQPWIIYKDFQMYTHCAEKRSINIEAFINLYDKIVGFIKKSLYLMPVKVPSITLSINLHFYHKNQLFYTF